MKMVRETGFNDEHSSFNAMALMAPSLSKAQRNPSFPLLSKNHDMPGLYDFQEDSLAYSNSLEVPALTATSSSSSILSDESEILNGNMLKYKVSTRGNPLSGNPSNSQASTAAAKMHPKPESAHEKLPVALPSARIASRPKRSVLLEDRDVRPGRLSNAASEESSPTAAPRRKRLPPVLKPVRVSSISDIDDTPQNQAGAAAPTPKMMTTPQRYGSKSEDEYATPRKILVSKGHSVFTKEADRGAGAAVEVKQRPTTPPSTPAAKVSGKTAEDLSTWTPPRQARSPISVSSFVTEEKPFDEYSQFGVKKAVKPIPRKEDDDTSVDSYGFTIAADSLDPAPFEYHPSTVFSHASTSVASGDSFSMNLHVNEGYVMASVKKPSLNHSLGLGIVQRPYDWRMVIATIAPQGLLGSEKTGLRVGQTILSINDVPANKFSSVEQAISTMKAAKKVSIMATKSVIATVPLTNLGVGMTLAYSKDGADLVITDIDAESAADDSGVFDVGMKILAINGKTQWSLEKARTLLAGDHQKHNYCQEETVTILAVSDETVVSSGPTSEVDPQENTTKTLRLFLEEASVMANVVKRLDRKGPNAEGIAFTDRVGDWRTLISYIDPNGPFASTDLRVGQTILAVNGIPADQFQTAGDIKVALQQSRTRMDIVATKSILATVKKPTVDTKVGISFARSTQHGTLFIDWVAPLGLFGTSRNGVLEEGMKLIAINDHTCKDLEEVKKAVKNCVGPLSILGVMDENETIPGRSFRSASAMEKEQANGGSSSPTNLSPPSTPERKSLLAGASSWFR